VLVLAGSPTKLFAGELHPGGAWATSTLTVTEGTSFGTSLTTDSAGDGVGVYTSSNGATVNATIWSAGAWSAPAPITASAVARAQPFVDATGGPTAHLLFQDANYKFNYLAHTAGGWTTTAQSVGGNYGPVPATIAALGANATAGFIDGQGPDVNYAAASDLTGSTATWATRVDPGAGGNFAVPATIVPLSAGPDVMMVYVSTTTQIFWLTRTAGAWTAPAPLTNGLTGNPVALAPLPSGGAILAIRGTDTLLYWSRYTGGAWSALAAFSTPNVAVDVSPAVTHGVGGDAAELAYVSGGSIYAAQLSGSTWSAPALVGGAGVNGVAIAATP